MIIDAHCHLWLRQEAVVNGKEIRPLPNGRSMFMGEEVQMLPPFLIDGVNSAEVLLSNMDYAQVSAAVVTQEFIDGLQNDYLEEVAKRYPERFFVFGMCEFRSSTEASGESRFPPPASFCRKAASGWTAPR